MSVSSFIQQTVRPTPPPFPSLLPPTTLPSHILSSLLLLPQYYQAVPNRRELLGFIYYSHIKVSHLTLSRTHIKTHHTCSDWLDQIIQGSPIAFLELMKVYSAALSSDHNLFILRDVLRINITRNAHLVLHRNVMQIANTIKFSKKITLPRCIYRSV